MLIRRSSFVLLFLSFAIVVNSTREKATRNVIVTAEEEKVRDAAGYSAIADIHREMDDDNSGSIDRKETSGFMTEDMHMRSSDRLRRENAFHGNDEAITVDDLWEAWFESDERAWTNEQLVHWITNIVNLPMYADRIVKLKIDGKHLPRLAVHNSSFMSKELGIKSSVHRQKLRLNALDVVLFGYRDNTSRTKDILFSILFVVLTGVLIFLAKQRKRALHQVGELSNRLTELKSMRTEFESAEKQWNEERSKLSTADDGANQTEMENLRTQLEEAERRLEQNGCFNTPLALQPLLRKTCENEMAFLEKQRQDCLKEMKEAIEMVDRLQKKQGSVLSSLKLATGAASASDQVDSKIFALKTRMEKIHGLTKESQERWMQIESLCGFPLLYTGETGLIHSSSSQFYSNRSGSSSVSSKSAAQTNSQSKMSTTSPHIIHPSAVTQFQSSKNGEPLVFGSMASTANGTDVNTSPSTLRFVPVHAESAPVLGEDDESVISLTLTNGSHDKKKKKKGILGLFKKTNSKGSVLSTSST